MSQISIITKPTERSEVVAPLRKLLPELSIGDIRQRLASSGALIQREIFDNEWEEVHALLRDVIGVLKQHRVDFELHESSSDDAPTPGNPATLINEETLENILKGHADEVERQRDA